MTRLAKIAWANVRRHQGQTASLLAMMLIAGLVASLGLLLILRYATEFDRQAAAQNAPDLSFAEPDTLYDASHAASARALGAATVETEPVVLLSGEVAFNGADVTATAMYSSVTTDATMDVLTLLDGAEPLTDTSVYAPHLLADLGGYRIGDRLTVRAADGPVLGYTIAGFYNAVYFVSPTSQWYHLYLTAAAFADLQAELPADQWTLLNLQVADGVDANRLYLDYVKANWVDNPLNTGDIVAYSTSLDAAVGGRTFMATIVALIMVTFAALLVILALFVVRFRVRTAIEDSTKDIGALKAVGYTSGQVAGALILQYVGTAFAGAALGVALSYAAVPAVAAVLKRQSSIDWRPGFDAATALPTVVVLTGAILLVTAAAARRVRRLSPLAALRSGLSAHSFRRNWFPLDRSRGPLAWLLAAKQTLQTTGQAAMVAAITAVVAFTSVALVSTYHVTAVDTDRFVGLIAGELTDAQVTATPEAADAVLADLQTRPGVRKAFPYVGGLAMTLDGDWALATATADYAQLEGSALYDGRYPVHANEVAIGVVTARTAGLGIGDTVTLAAGGAAAEYLVTGLTQVYGDGSGYHVALTLDGLGQLFPGYHWTLIDVYLDDSADVTSFADAVTAEYGDAVTVTDTRRAWQATLGMYGDIFGAVAVAILAITVTVIGLVLYMVLSTTIRRRQRAYGIQKAVGFTGAQLMRQVTLTLLPAVALGVAAGAALGYLAFPALMDALFASMGLPSAAMTASALFTAGVAVLLVAAATAIACLVARRIRRVSAYTLVSE
ncbi:MAG: FtsX-like permease family protein [Propionibacteriaceae bacterium]|jgi:putative ABC transport system permease protein|nr:FtsX-like permease family protein [Propionibacteriaceae bacterium]